MLRKAFHNILVVVKQTPYEQYMQLKAQGKAPVALRWERLKNRFQVHKQCVDDVVQILEKAGLQYSVKGREELHRGVILDKDLIIVVGGDGTILNTASFLDDTIPVLGINSDPTKPEEQGVKQPRDERRSFGALCALTANNLQEGLPQILYGSISPNCRTRIQCLVRSTYTETRLPPALNDVLICHPSPAAVSRFRLTKLYGNVVPSYKPVHDFREGFSLNVWSSGIWVSTASGSTAAMHAAGGEIMDIRSENLQYIVREHLSEGGDPDQVLLGHGMILPTEMLDLRWNSQHGAVFVDGSHFKHDMELGDEVKLDGHAPVLQLFDPFRV